MISGPRFSKLVDFWHCWDFALGKWTAVRVFCRGGCIDL